MWDPTPEYSLPFTDEFLNRLLYQDNIGIDVTEYSEEELACEYQKEMMEQLALAAAAAGYLIGGGYSGNQSTSLSVDDILADPNLLRGRAPRNIKIPSNWRVETLGKGSHKGQGWVLREYNSRGQSTGRMIRWHPGGGHHGKGPYWRVNSHNSKSGIIR